ncbi:MAG: hypothetical protein U0517_03040 [Candidatus Andersenbacteria bacterium]
MAFENLTEDQLRKLPIAYSFGWQFSDRSPFCPNGSTDNPKTNHQTQRLLIHPAGAHGCPICKHFEMLDQGSLAGLAVLAETTFASDVAS